MIDPKVLSIAAIDPSGGAGLLSDIKTYMHFRIEGFGAVSGITYQDEDTMYGVEWVSVETIIQQLEPLFNRYEISALKIGMIKDLETLISILNFIRSKQQNVQIIWDPVLSSSSGFNVHNHLNNAELKQVLDKIDIITPNKDELNKLRSWLGDKSELLPVKVLVLKGGHSSGERVLDKLYVNGEEVCSVDGVRVEREMHGTGCMFSSAMAASLASGKELTESFRTAHEYVRSLLIAADSKLAPQHLMV